jgi:glucose-6-phosphate dehydrogenase assembly protein OpcA
MSEDVWAERDTTPAAIEAALRELLRRRHAADHRLAPARVLNLIVVVDREWKGEIANRLERVGRYHASRTILCAVEEGRETLDAVATITYDEDAAGEVHPVHENVDIDLGSDQLAGLDTIVDPILVDELPTLVWSPHGHDDAVEALRSIADVILLDSDDQESDVGLGRAAELMQSAYVVDLAWLRTTPWRERLAASFDPPERLKALSELTDVTVRHRPTSSASAALLAGWFASRLDWRLDQFARSDGDGWSGTAARTEEGDQVEIALTPVDQEAPGLAGVTVAWHGCSLSLDRGRGGLTARYQTTGGAERSWRVLGASRGEGGILGEGVRQALLRDPTYSPALAAARTICA